LACLLGEAKPVKKVVHLGVYRAKISTGEVFPRLAEKGLDQVDVGIDRVFMG
jgi:hypothetical protein